MDIDAWNHWLLLRPLIVFVLAAPLIVAAVFIGWRQGRKEGRRQAVSATLEAENNEDKPRAGARQDSGKRRSKAPAAEKPREAQTDEVDAYRATVTMPREWDSGPLRSNLIRQARLGSGR
jgi:hypothetical protein